MSIFLADEAATIALAERLQAVLPKSLAGLTLLLEGELGAGDVVEWEHRAENSMTVRDVARLVTFDAEQADAARRAAGLSALSQEWRDRIAAALAKLED